MNAIIVNKCDLSALERVVFKNGLLQPMPHDFYKKRDRNELHYFMLVHSVYVLPTCELIEWLKKNTEGYTIEIGCGLGTIGRSMGIPITDSKSQNRPEIRLLYAISGQRTINYPDDVEELEAMEAVEKYKPETVIGGFITHKFDGETGYMYGVDEFSLLNKIGKYINIGNAETHAEKPVLDIVQDIYHYEWLLTRAADQSKNRIWVFKGGKS